LSNPSLIQEMGKNSIKIIKEEVNIDTVVYGYAMAFKYVMNH